MEHDEKPLPIDIRLLGALAEKVDFFIFFNCVGVCSCVNFRYPYSCVGYICRSRFLHICCMFALSVLQCRAFAKALHYKEMEFEGARSKKMDANPVAVVEVLIHINNQLQQHEVSFSHFHLFVNMY